MTPTTDQLNDHRLMMALAALECGETDLDDNDESNAMCLLAGLDRYTLCLLASAATSGWVVTKACERQRNGLSREEALAELAEEFRAKALRLADQLAEMEAAQ